MTAGSAKPKEYRVAGISMPGGYRLRGFTLIEMMIVVAIVAVLAAVAFPAFNDFIDKGRVKQVTEEVFGLITQAKMETALRNEDMTVDIHTTDPWCVGFVSGAAGCDCEGGGTACQVMVGIQPVTQVVSRNDFDFPAGLAITGASSFTFDRIRGTTNQGTIIVNSGNWQLGITRSNNTGRVRVCSPADGGGVKGITGYPACP